MTALAKIESFTADGALFTTFIDGKPDLVRFIRHTGFCEAYHSQKMPIASIQEIVARYFGLSSWDMLSKCRERKVAHPRQIAMYLARDLTGHSTPEIGRRFGNRHHTTVLHAILSVEDRMETIEGAKGEVHHLRDLIVRALA